MPFIFFFKKMYKIKIDPYKFKGINKNHEELFNLLLLHEKQYIKSQFDNGYLNKDKCFIYKVNDIWDDIIDVNTKYNIKNYLDKNQND